MFDSIAKLNVPYSNFPAILIMKPILAFPAPSALEIPKLIF
jgi:hypothetical protein